MTRIERALIHTLVYGDIFEYPLKENELWRYLIGIKTKLSLFRASLASLTKLKLIDTNHGYYFLKKRSAIVDARIRRAKCAKHKLLVARSAARLLSLIPTVYFVGVSGALAMENAPAEDDIDFFIITAPGALWTTRFLATLTLDISGIRRKPEEISFENKVCLNMFIDASRLRLPKNEQDLYSAHEIAQLKPLYNKYNTLERFQSANSWVHSFLPQAFSRKTISYKEKYTSKPIHIFETFLKYIQLTIMKKRRTNEKINTYVLRFHPNDMRGYVLERYKIGIQKYNLRRHSNRI